MITEITKLISIILAISLASERLVTMLKTFIPWLASDQTPGPPNDPAKDKTRKLVVMGIAFLAAWFTSGFLAVSDFMLGSIEIVPKILYLPCILMGLLASGGSAFWTNLLGYFKGLKDIKTQQLIGEKLNNEEKLHAFAARDTTAFRRSAATDLKTVRFTASFSGGDGTLKVQIDGYPDIDFENDGYKDIQLQPGGCIYAVSGAAAPGVGGGALLTISGPVISDSPHQYGPGLIFPNVHPMLVTS